MIQLISVMSELGAGTRGSGLAMDALHVASLIKERDFFDRYPAVNVRTENHLLRQHAETPAGKHLEGIVRMYRRIGAQVAETLDDGLFPLVIAGDHSNAGGTIAGLKLAFPHQRIGAVWIDAHADLHSPYTSPSGNVHGMPLATAIADDNTACQVASPKRETAEMWNRMKGGNQRIAPSDIAFIGLRSTEPPEDHLIEQHNMAVFRTADVRRDGAGAIVAQTLDRLSDCDRIYVSFDVDSMDPTVSEGTGTPVPGGIFPDEAAALLRGFAASEKVCCLEFTEINPLLDTKGNVMAEVGFDLLKSTVETLEARFGK